MGAMRKAPASIPARKVWALKNMELKVVWPDREGRFTCEPGAWDKPALLYPGPGSMDLASVPAGERPSELVLLDGTWRDVSKLYRHNPWLEKLPRYRLDPPEPSRYRLRREPSDKAISTVEAIVQSLAILEPDTPGLDTLISVFEAMIDRQIAQIRARPAGTRIRCPRRVRQRAPRPMPEALKGTLGNLVLAYGESVPGRETKRTLVRWSALRLDDGALFDCLISPRDGTEASDDHLHFMGLQRRDMVRAEPVEAFRRSWEAFLRPDDTLLCWNRALLLWLEDLADIRHPSFHLKEAWSNTRGGKCGHLEDVVRDNGLELPAIEIEGRAARRLAQLAAVTRELNRLAAALPCPANGGGPA